MKKLVCVLASIMTIGLFAFASPGQAAVLAACQVVDPPTNCEEMWAVIAHVRLPKQPILAVSPNPGCGSKFKDIDWGRTVADGFLAEVDRDTLENLAMDVSDALQKKLVPQFARHIRATPEPSLRTISRSSRRKRGRPPATIRLCAPPSLQQFQPMRRSRGFGFGHGMKTAERWIVRWAA
jgi:hypothetical protein